MYPHLCLNKEEKLLVDLSLGRETELPSRNSPQWERLWEQCRTEGTAGLVYFHLKQNKKENGAVPPEIFLKLKGEYQRIAAVHWAQSLALESLDSACFKEGLQLLIFRGLVLADLLYRNPGCRPSIDIDLMASPASLPIVRNILANQGFIPNANHPNVFMRPPVAIDLHSDLANIYLFSAYGHVFNYKPEAVWNETKKFGSFQAIRRLGDADQFNFLVLHLVKHSFRRLIWWVDLYKSILRMDQNSLSTTWNRAGDFRLDRLVGGMLFYFGEMFPEIRSSFPLIKPEGMAAWLFRRMLQGKKFEWTGMLLYLFSIPEYRWRIKLVAEKLTKRFTNF